MKKIIIILALMFFNHVAIAGTIYTYTDKDGNTVISNTPMPENYEKKAKRIESYERDSPAAIAAYQIKQRAAEARDSESGKIARAIPPQQNRRKLQIMSNHRKNAKEKLTTQISCERNIGTK